MGGSGLSVALHSVATRVFGDIIPSGDVRLVEGRSYSLTARRQNWRHNGCLIGILNKSAQAERVAAVVNWGDCGAKEPNLPKSRAHSQRDCAVLNLAKCAATFSKKFPQNAP